MELEWDETKRKTNLSKHGLDFGNAREFDLDSAACVTQYEQGEHRLLAIGWHRGRMTTMVLVERGDRVRIVSWRRATRREREFWHEQF